MTLIAGAGLALAACGGIGAAYGQAAENTFNQIWSAHDGFFVDDTTAVAKHDAAGKAAAVDNLRTKYVGPFSQFLSGATGLPNDTVTRLITEQVQQTAAIVDAQAANSYPSAAQRDRAAAMHMMTIGDGLAAGIVKTNPGLFR